MAKSFKRKSLVGKIFSLFFSLIMIAGFGVGIAAGVLEGLVSPNSEKVKAYYSAENDNIEVYTKASDPGVQVFTEINFPKSNYTDCLMIVKGAFDWNNIQSMNDIHYGYVLYFDDIETSFKQYKILKEKAEKQAEQDGKEMTQIFRPRGKALYIGDKETLKLYNLVIF